MGTGEGGPADADLLARLRARDESAFRELVRREGPTVRAYALGLLGTPEDADDAAQEVFLRAYRRLPAFRGDAALTTWLLRICRNHCLDRIRSRRPEAPLPEGLVSTVTTPGAAMAGIQRDRMLAAVARLPEHLQQVMVLCELRGWSAREAGDALGIPDGTVRSRLHAGRAALRGAIGEEGP